MAGGNPQGVMDDFSDALDATLSRNVELQRERDEAERAQRQRREEQRREEERRRQEQREHSNAHHEELVGRLQQLLVQLQERAGESVVSRGGWTESGEEFVVKLSTVRMSPHRSLFLELDRDDDEVLVRWTSDVGNSVEVWRLLEFTPEMLRELILQLIDQELWVDAARPPSLHGLRGAHEEAQAERG